MLGLERPVVRIVEIMRAAYLAGHEVIIVTARWKPLNPHRVSPPTIQWWLRQWKMPDVEIHYTSMTLKGPLLKRLGVALHFDDAPEQVASAREHGISVMVMEPSDLV